MEAVSSFLSASSRGVKDVSATQQEKSGMTYLPGKCCLNSRYSHHCVTTPSLHLANDTLWQRVRHLKDTQSLNAPSDTRCMLPFSSSASWIPDWPLFPVMKWKEGLIYPLELIHLYIFQSRLFLFCLLIQTVSAFSVPALFSMAHSHYPVIFASPILRLEITQKTLQKNKPFRMPRSSCD